MDSRPETLTPEHVRRNGNGAAETGDVTRRPWGSFRTLDSGDRFQVKELTVAPGESLSLQMHHHRSEHWVVVSGTALVVRGDDEVYLAENDHIHIAVGQKHRLHNPGMLPLCVIEVQSGPYLGEDDIVRFEDVYDRVAS